MPVMLRCNKRCAMLHGSRTHGPRSAQGLPLPGQIALILQGGGALGAYQAGVYEALDQAAVRPDWVVGISIGAINAALIAGNAPAARVGALTAFWETVTQEHPWSQAAGLVGPWSPA